MMKNRNKIKSKSIEYSDFGLGLKMQAEFSEFEKTRDFSFNKNLFHSAGNDTNTTPSTVGRGRGGGLFFWDMISRIQTCGTNEIYAAGTAGGGGGGGMAVSEKSLFTASQLQELERQQMIYKYMMASIPVPHELMLSMSRTSYLAGAQSKMCLESSSGVDSRFPSSKLDPEPWRCRRTDGKKWRCSRNAAAEQRYCERHSHKNKPRSRKHVEAKNSTQQSLQSPPTSQFPVMAPGLGAIPCNQARGIEWCKRGGSSGTAIPVSTCDYQQQMQQISSRLDLMNRDNAHHQKNVSQSPTLQEQDFKPAIPNRFEFSHGEYCNSPSRMTSFQENLSLNPNRSHTTTPLFIDAWEQGMRGLSPSSLTYPNDVDHRFGVGLNDSERPGGPLGEALCLGNASNSDLLSSNDYNYDSCSSVGGSHSLKSIR